MILVYRSNNKYISLGLFFTGKKKKKSFNCLTSIKIKWNYRRRHHMSKSLEWLLGKKVFLSSWVTGCRRSNNMVKHLESGLLKERMTLPKKKNLSFPSLLIDSEHLIKYCDLAAWLEIDRNTDDLKSGWVFVVQVHSYQFTTKKWQYLGHLTVFIGTLKIASQFWCSIAVLLIWIRQDPEQLPTKSLLFRSLRYSFYTAEGWHKQP